MNSLGECNGSTPIASLVPIEREPNNDTAISKIIHSRQKFKKGDGTMIPYPFIFQTHKNTIASREEGEFFTYQKFR